MIENFQEEPYQLVKKQLESAKLNANIKWELEDKESPKTFFKAHEKQNMQGQTISNLYTEDKKSKFS